MFWNVAPLHAWRRKVALFPYLVPEPRSSSEFERYEQERLDSLLMNEDPLAAIEPFGRIAEAIVLLEHHPLIGRQVDEFRQLVFRAEALATWLYTALNPPSTQY